MRSLSGTVPGFVPHSATALHKAVREIKPRAIPFGTTRGGLSPQIKADKTY